MHSCQTCVIHDAAGQTLLLLFKQLFAEFCSKMASVRKPVLISKRSAIDAILVLCSKVIKTFPECEVQATVSMLSKDSFTHNYKSELSNKEKEGEKTC